MRFNSVTQSGDAQQVWFVSIPPAAAAFHRFWN
jgi:hypothetical protein